MQQQYIPITYNINKLDELFNDTTKRNQIFSKFYNLMDERVKVQYQYAQKLKEITMSTMSSQNHHNLSKSNYVNNNNNKPSQILLNMLIKLIQKQSQNRYKLAKQMDDEVLIKIKDEFNFVDKQNKRNITLIKSLKKQIDNEFQILQKNKTKFYKKTLEVEKLKLDYIVSVLVQQRDFQKKNKLFLKIKQIQSQASPLKKNYQQSSTKYNQILSTFTLKMGKIFKKLQQNQLMILSNMKNSLINKLLFHSAHGAILVHQTQVALSFLTQIKTEQSQLQPSSSKQIQIQTKNYENNFSNPSQYFDEIFKKIQENRIEQIIKYGQSFQYRSQLSNFFENTKNLQGYKHINDYTIRIIQIFKTVFEGEQYSESILIEFSQLIKAKPHLRKDFILCLQKYRLQGKFQIYKNNFNNIIKLINIFLDICQSQLDTYNSKQFMVLSFTYYFVDENSEKIDLQHFVRQHKIWQNIKWWQCSLLQSIYEQHKFKNKKAQSLNPTISLWDIKGVGMKKTDSQQDNSTLSNICFNQMAYYVHNMQLFSFKNNQVNVFAQKYIKILALNSRMAQDLLAMCKSQKKISINQK